MSAHHPPTLVPLATKDILTGAELSPQEIHAVYATAQACKRSPRDFDRALHGRSAVLIFEKPSLRTRLSFEVGVARLGGHALFYDHAKERIGERESVHDYARNLERWVDVIIARTYSHQVIEDLGSFARVPVINALSDEYHPCQALADVFTLQEHLGTLGGAKLAYVGDANNVCRSLVLVAVTLGVHVTVIAPDGFGLDDATLTALRRSSTRSGSSVAISSDPAAVAGHDAIYTDAWTSMGWEAEAQRRRKVFLPYQVNARLLAMAGTGARFMHCLPAHRGEEVTDEVIDSPRSIVFDQAENRMHVQNGLLLHLLARGRSGAVPDRAAASA